MKRTNYWPRVAQIIGLSISLLTITITAYIQFFERMPTSQTLTYNPMNDPEWLSRNEEQKLDSIKRHLSQDIIRLNDSIFDEAPFHTYNDNFTHFDERLRAVSNKVITIGQSVDELRQAINPLKPDEVLTVVRLKDELIAMRNEIDVMKKQVDRDQDNLRNLIFNKIESADKSVNLILVVLLPLILNFLYTVYKDRQDIKEKNSVKNKDEKD